MPDRVSGVYVFGYLVMCNGGTVGGKEPGWPCSVPAERARLGPLLRAACGPASPAPASGCPWDMRHGGSGSIWKVRAGAGGGVHSELSIRGLAVPICGKCSACPSLRLTLSQGQTRALSHSLSPSFKLSIFLCPSPCVCCIHLPPSSCRPTSPSLSSHAHTHTHTHSSLQVTPQDYTCVCSVCHRDTHAEQALDRCQVNE